MKHLKWVIRNISVIKLYKWIDSIKITFNFYFPRTSRHNYRGVDVFSDIFELLLLLYFTFMTRARCLKSHFAIIQKSDLYATLHQRLWICQRRSCRLCIGNQKIYVPELLKKADQYKKLQVWNLIGSGWSESGIFSDFVCISFHELGSDSQISKWAGILVLLSNVDQ